MLCLAGFAAADNKRTVDGPVIGIDLGTTYSCVGIFKNGRVEIIPNEFGNRITPSYVAFTDEERLVGEAAKNQASSNPERTIYVVKRLIGRKFDDKEVQRDVKWVPYSVVSKGGKPYVSVDMPGTGNKTFSPEEISAMIQKYYDEKMRLGFIHSALTGMCSDSDDFPTWESVSRSAINIGDMVMEDINNV